MDTEKVIKLKSNDGKIVEITRKAASKSGLLKGIIEDFPEDSEFPLNDVDGETLRKIKQYLIHYEDMEPPQIQRPLKSTNFKECVDIWDYNFIEVSSMDIFKLVLATNYMDIKPLFDLSCAKIGSQIQGITTESIRKEFEINGGFSKEEQELILKDKQYLEENL